MFNFSNRNVCYYKSATFREPDIDARRAIDHYHTKACGILHPSCACLVGDGAFLSSASNTIYVVDHVAVISNYTSHRALAPELEFYISSTKCCSALLPLPTFGTGFSDVELLIFQGRLSGRNRSFLSVSFEQ